ncbi:MAG: cyanophycinase [Gemmatimonadota bacterium]
MMPTLVRPRRWYPALLLAAGAVFPAPLLGQAPPKGHLFIVGGGDAPPELAARFVALAGGPGHARIIVVPMASSEPEATGQEKVAELVALGADAMVVNVDRRGASDPVIGARLSEVSGVWFSGGDQGRLTGVLSDTPLLAAIRARYRAGAVIGGTSAGAAIMSDSMITGNQRSADSVGYFGDEFPSIARNRIEVVAGLGFLPGAVVDQHFIRRERFNRLLSVVLEQPKLQGVGIDEGTALEVGPDGEWRVLGRSSVLILDARRARLTQLGAPVLGATGVGIMVLPTGSRYRPRQGLAVLPR